MIEVSWEWPSFPRRAPWGIEEVNFWVGSQNENNQIKDTIAEKEHLAGSSSHLRNKKNDKKIELERKKSFMTTQEIDYDVRLCLVFLKFMTYF